MYPVGSRGDYPFDEGKHLVVVVEWWAYGDESGLGEKYCCVFGYVASPRQWRMLTREWRSVLRDVPEFHAKEFFQKASWQSSTSPYHGWTMKKARRYLNGLLRTIDGHDIRPIGFAYDTADFMALAEHDRRLLTGAINRTRSRVRKGRLEVTDKLMSTGAPSEPYCLGFQYLITEALKASPPGTIVNYVFDRRKTREGWAFQTFDGIKEYSTEPIVRRLGLLSFGDSEQYPPLQAADMIAYLANRTVHETVNNELVQRALDVLGQKQPNKPGGFLSNAKRAVHLVGADTVLGVGDQPDGREPLVEADWTILEDGAHLDRELLARVLVLALPQATGSDEAGLIPPAGGAANAVPPAQGRHELQAHIGIGEVPDGF